MSIKTSLRRLALGMYRNMRYSNGLQICYNRIFRHGSRLEHYVWKKRFHFVADPRVNDHFSLHEIFCGRIYDSLLARCASTDGRCKYVNVGANIGGFDVKVMEMGFGIDGSVAVELNPATCERCRVNFRANGVAATLINAGIAGEDGTVDFHPGADSLQDSIYGIRGGVGGAAVRLLSLGRLMEDYPGDGSGYDLLKLDCEGAEYAILRHTPISALRRFRNILVEFHAEPPGGSVDDAYRKLGQAGFAGANRGPRKGVFVELFTRSGGVGDDR